MFCPLISTYLKAKGLDKLRLVPVHHVSQIIVRIHESSFEGPKVPEK